MDLSITPAFARLIATVEGRLRAIHTTLRNRANPNPVRQAGAAEPFSLSVPGLSPSRFRRVAFSSAVDMVVDMVVDVDDKASCQWAQ